MAAYATRVFEALADPTRRQIFEYVVEEPASVTALAERLPVSRPAVSQHLRVLKDAKLVMCRAEGTRRIYTADEAGPTAVRAYFQRFWDERLNEFAGYVSRQVSNQVEDAVPNPAPNQEEQ